MIAALGGGGGGLFIPDPDISTRIPDLCHNIVYNNRKKRREKIY
jgi:hypothetical protein